MKKLSTCLVMALLTLGFARAQDPAAQQDAEAAREKLLKAADQLDLIETNAEANKTALDSLKADLARIQDDNAALHQQVAALQTALDQAKAEHAKERQVLLDEVAQMVAGTKSAPRKHTPALAPTTPEPDKPTSPKVSAPDVPTETAAADPAPAEKPAPPQKGYYHIVEAGETLTMITGAYRDQGVKVTVAQVRKANGLTEKSVLKVGQKLFIPKPGA